MALAAACSAGAAYVLALSSPRQLADAFLYSGAVLSVVLALLVLFASRARAVVRHSAGFALIVLTAILSALAALGSGSFGVLLVLVTPLALFCDAGQTCVETLHHLLLAACLYLLAAVLFAVFTMVVVFADRAHAHPDV